MKLDLEFPEPAVWIVGTILVITLVRFLANLCLPGND